LRQTVQLVNRLPQLKAPRDFVLTPAMASDKIIAFPGQQRSRLLKFGLPILSAAASVLVILIGLGALLSSQSLQSPTSGSTAPQADVAALSSATARLTLDATLTLDGLPLDQTLLATEDVEQAAESEIQTETDDEASIMMEMGIPSASPSLDEFNAAGSAAMDSAVPLETMPLMTTSATALATSLPGTMRQAFDGTATLEHYESSPVIVGTLSLTDAILPPASDLFSIQTTVDPAAAATIIDGDGQAKRTEETASAAEESMLEQDQLLLGGSRFDDSTGAIVVTVGIVTLILVIRLLR
ncbi:MAG: hypothetical protein H7X77_08395, partial [Anaerolineae bacterium]|nr:hypothetical protein [Anaerolineae bacterium]